MSSIRTQLNGNRLKPPTNEEMDGYIVKVTKVPPHLGQDAIHDLFLQFGQITETKLVQTTAGPIAFVTFASYADAELAINEVSDQKPLHLHVDFVDKNLKNLEPHKNFDLSKPIADFRYQPDTLESTQGKKFLETGPANCSPALRATTHPTDEDLLYPSPMDYATYNPYENPGPFENTNLMYTRGMTHISKDGRRHISYGRGFTYYSLPEPNYNIGTCLQNVCERRENGYYEFAEDDVEDESGECEICSSPTAFKCAKCNLTYYCSKSCQVKAWPQHKTECQPLPKLIKKLKKLVPQSTTPIENKNCNETETPVVKSLRKPKVMLEQESQIPSKKENKETKDLQTKFNGQKSEPVSSNFQALASSFPVKQKQPKEPLQHEDRVQNQKLSEVEDNIRFEPQDDFIPKNRYVEVSVTAALGNGEYYVQKTEDAQKIQDLVVEIASYVEGKPRSVPDIDVKCLVEWDGIWFRAVIVGKDNENCKVFFEDFGTYDDIVVTQVIPIGPFENHPLPMSRRICFDENSKRVLPNLQVEDCVQVKCIKVVNSGTILVAIKDSEQLNKQIENLSLNKDSLKPNHKSANDQTKNVTVKQSESLDKHSVVTDAIDCLDSVFFHLKEGEDGIIIFAGELSHLEYGTTVAIHSDATPFEKVVTNLPEYCINYDGKNDQKNVEIGGMIAVEHNNDWFRGIVVCVTPVLKVALIDECKILTPNKYLPLSEEFKNVYKLGLICTFEPEIELSGPLEPAEFTVIEASISAAKIVVNIGTKKYKATLTKWCVKPEQKGIERAPLRSGQEVIIVDFVDQDTVYVHSLEDSEKERRHQLEQKVAKYALNRKPLDKTPVVGQMVLAQYELDKNFYRAIINKVEGNMILAKYIDYGNVEISKIENLYILSDDIKELPACAEKVKLQGVKSKEEAPLTEEASTYLSQLISSAAPLTCTFTGDPTEDGVILTSAHKENINTHLNDALTPTWEKGADAHDGKKVWTLNDLPDTVLGSVGENIEVIPLAYYVDRGLFVMAPNDEIAIQALHVDMVQSIANYVEKTDGHYIPRDKELCIASYEGIFYRAICLARNATPDSSRVMFIDFGNTEIVKHTDMREFVEDFSTIGALGVLCSISTLLPNNAKTKEISERIRDLVPLNELIDIKILGKDETDIPDIDIPVLRLKLKGENLI
ncbi:tudor domain-containing protein 1 [Trichogramma pretiosum]|uniref:tudor domain-containing protein 1 n=1 Tax=Trichogramma pretiosum TaxID=7493 RepID=UPI0006C980D2|nr:tudor domain-containing protein 1 [Trichogramma pretiosum]XP_014235732.1 tudor domain-containing protein 1 [Trichogramma pretiosum]